MSKKEDLKSRLKFNSMNLGELGEYIKLEYALTIADDVLCEESEEPPAVVKMLKEMHDMIESYDK